MKRRFKGDIYRQLARVGKALASPKWLEILELLSGVRSFRLLAEDRLTEVNRIRQCFFAGDRELAGLDRTTLLERVKPGEVVVIVRPSNEYCAAHIAPGVSIPFHDPARRLADLPRDKTIVAYCRGPYCVLAAEANCCRTTDSELIAWKMALKTGAHRVFLLMSAERLLSRPSDE